MKKKTSKQPKKKQITKKVIKSDMKIVKRRGHVEVYDERKVYGSCYFACRNAHLSEIESEWISNKVCAAITKFLNRRKVVLSDDIFKLITEELKKYNQDASFLYETHRDIS